MIAPPGQGVAVAAAALGVVMDEASGDVVAVVAIERGAADQFVPEIVDLAVMQAELPVGMLRQQQEEAAELLFDTFRFQLGAIGLLAIAPGGEGEIEGKAGAGDRLAPLLGDTLRIDAKGE